MIVFIDTEAISSFFSDLIKEAVERDMKYSQELKKYEYEKQKLKEQKRLEKMKKEEEESYVDIFFFHLFD
jgi:hypothetical protein